MEDIEAWEAELDSIHSIMRNYLEDKKTLTAHVDKVAAAGDTDLTDLRIYFILFARETSAFRPGRDSAACEASPSSRSP